jgi:hypothetical protein
MQVLLDSDITAYVSCHYGEDDWDKTVENIESYLGWVLERFPGTPRLFLSGPNNFRKKIYPDYKANRKDRVKPVHLSALRDYLVTEWNAEVTDGYEADDAIGLAQGEDTIIISGDKDLKQIPGNHANSKTLDTYTISEEEAAYNFYRQLVTGDKGDNVKGLGIYGWGETSTKPDKLLVGLTKPELKKAVEDLYVEHHGEAWFELYDTAAQLLFIKRGDITKQYYDYY